MRKVLLVLTLLTAGAVLICPQAYAQYNYGDYRSSTLVGKAWAALSNNDLEAVLAYTNKCLELYGNQAKGMEASLKDYPSGSNDDIFSYWALNDVATALYIQGEAYRKAGANDKAKEAYQKLIDDYTYGQCWDKGGWFWKPAEAAKEKLAMMASGSNIDFGDYKSSTLATKAWNALNNKDLAAVMAYTNKCIQLYAAKAKEMQASLKEYPWQSKDKIFSYWALNDVGTCYFIQGEALRQAGKTAEAEKAYQTLLDHYSFAQCWDPKGWFWKPAEAARQKLDDLKAQAPSASTAPASATAPAAAAPAATAPSSTTSSPDSGSSADSSS